MVHFNLTWLDRFDNGGLAFFCVFVSCTLEICSCFSETKLEWSCGVVLLDFNSRRPLQKLSDHLCIPYAISIYLMLLE